MIPVEGHSNLFRDEDTGAIVNNNGTEFESYINNRETRRNQLKDIDNLKSDVADIKTMLEHILLKL